MAPLQFEHPAGLGSFGKLTSVRQSEGGPRVLVYDVWGCSRGCPRTTFGPQPRKPGLVGRIGLLIHTQRDQVKKAVFLETDSTAVATAV